MESVIENALGTVSERGLQGLRQVALSASDALPFRHDIKISLRNIHAQTEAGTSTNMKIRDSTNVTYRTAMSPGGQRHEAHVTITFPVLLDLGAHTDSRGLVPYFLGLKLEGSVTPVTSASPGNSGRRLLDELLLSLEKIAGIAEPLVLKHDSMKHPNILAEDIALALGEMRAMLVPQLIVQRLETRVGLSRETTVGGRAVVAVGADGQARLERLDLTNKLSEPDEGLPARSVDANVKNVATHVQHSAETDHELPSSESGDATIPAGQACEQPIGGEHACDRQVQADYPHDHESNGVLTRAPLGDVFIALGSNVGDRLEAIEAACQAIDEDGDMRIIHTSSLYETEPMYVEDQDRFLNGVCEVGNARFKSDAA